jgi:hypothetical protein
LTRGFPDCDFRIHPVDECWQEEKIGHQRRKNGQASQQPHQHVGLKRAGAQHAKSNKKYQAGQHDGPSGMDRSVFDGRIQRNTSQGFHPEPG